MIPKIIEFTDKITVTYQDGTTKVFVEEQPTQTFPSVTIPLGTPIVVSAA